MNPKITIRGALLWSFGERYTSLIVTIAGSMILARLLTPTEIGVFSLCAAVTAVAGILRNFGISEYLIQEKDLTQDKIRAAYTLAILTAWSIAGIVYFSRTMIADYYAESGVASVLEVLTLNFLLLPFASPAFALLTREMAFRKVYAVQITSHIISTATTIFLAYQGHGFMSLAWGTVVNIICQNVMLALVRSQDTFIMPSLKEARAVLSYGSVFVSSRVIETFTRNAHEYIIAKQLGFAAVGMFSRGMGLIELFYGNVTAAVLRVTTPMFADQHRSGEDLPARYALGTTMLTVVAWPFYGYLALMSDEIILILFGPQWGAAAPITTALALSLMPTYLTVMGPNLLAATGHVKVRLKITLQYAPIHVLAMLLASHISLLAMAIAFCVTAIIGLLLYVSQLKKVFNCTARDLFSGVERSAAVAVVCIALQSATYLLCEKYGLHALISLILVAAGGLAGWLLAAWAIAHPAHTEVARYLVKKTASVKAGRTQ